MPVILQNRQRAAGINLARLRRTAVAVLTATRTGDAELSVMLVSDRRMRALNFQYRKQDRSTDVLAFPMYESGPPRRRSGAPAASVAGRSSGTGRVLARPGRAGEEASRVLIGDVVISLPTARRQAAERGHGLFDEVVRLLVHGILHLLGYDHERGPREAARMARRERAILRMIR